MAGANFSAITKIFGEEVKSATKSREFHFKVKRNKKANRLNHAESSSEFKELCEQLLISTTEQAYNNAKGRAC